MISAEREERHALLKKILDSLRGWLTGVALLEMGLLLIQKSTEELREIVARLKIE